MFGASSSLSCLEIKVARAEVARAEVSRQQSSDGSLPRSGGRGVGWQTCCSSGCTLLKVHALMVGFGDALK